MAVVVVSWSAILIRLCDAPPTVIAGYRLALASVVLVPWALARGWRPAASPALGWALLAGLALALHFYTWISSLQHTRIANSTLLLSLQIIVAPLLSHWVLKERLTRWIGLGCACALAGSMVISVADWRFSLDHIVGDLLAMVSAVCVSFYYLFGKLSRRRLDTLHYVAIAYPAAALCMVAAAVGSGDPLTGYSRATYGWLVLLALGPTVIGHSLFNHALKYFKVYQINLVILCEPPLTALFAYWVFGEGVTGAVWAGGGGILLGCLIALLGERWAARAPTG